MDPSAVAVVVSLAGTLVTMFTVIYRTGQLIGEVRIRLADLERRLSHLEASVQQLRAAWSLDRRGHRR